MAEDKNTSDYNRPQQTSEDLKALLREAEAALGDASALGSEQVAQLKGRLRSALEQGKETLGHAADMARKQAERADEMVRANPYVAIGCAAVIGAVIGSLCAKRCRCA